IVNHEEMVTRFAMEAMAHMILTGDRVVDVKRESFDRYNAYLDKREVLKIYTDSRAQNFFMNKYARSSVMCPLGPSEMWRMFRDDGPNDIVFSN
ncbi:MAG: hypothetical protein KAY22_22680, partial [Rhizorhabdus sp.]|nr:hypothetical protein [Rhizorhabdus sp.]